MTQPKNLDPYTSPRAFYGAELRRLREAAGLSQEQLGERVFCSGTYAGQFESATRRPQPDVSKLFDEVLGCGEHFRRLCELARQSKHAEHFADAPPVVYVESAHTGQLIDESALVERYQKSYDLVRAVALSPKASLALIESAAKDYSTP
jgi:transcriptional regulator with XRE-family HTH domain